MLCVCFLLDFLVAFCFVSHVILSKSDVTVKDCGWPLGVSLSVTQRFSYKHSQPYLEPKIAEFCLYSHLAYLSEGVSVRNTETKQKLHILPALLGPGRGPNRGGGAPRAGSLVVCMLF